MTNNRLLKCSIGILAHNEEKNIGRLLEALLNQKLNQVEIEEIFIIGDGCTDQTIPIANSFIKKDKRIKVIDKRERGGKFSVINIFLKKAKNSILVMESGDTLPKKNTVENLVKPFSSLEVGMTGCRPIPVDNPKTLMGYTTHLLWELHHQVSLKNPKMGEMTAFRKIFDKIPPTAVDEAYIEGFIKNEGYNVVYVPKAVVYNKGPETVSDFLCQRKRIYWGHLDLKERTSYRVSTVGFFKIMFLVLKNLKFDFRYFLFTTMAIFFEGLARFLGWWDYKVKKKSYIIWNIAKSTKTIKNEQ
ncbi:glycosyltransferase [Patescibacteria group bacterium]